MVIDKLKLSQMLKQSAALWLQNYDELSAIDSKYGDGDHGITIKKIASLLDESLPLLNEMDMYEYFEELGSRIMGVNGGSAGPLYGTMIGGLGIPLKGRTTIDAAVFREMLQSSLQEMQDITTAKVGDKTMMDSLIPAVQAVAATEGEFSPHLSELLRIMSEAAMNGAEKSKDFASKFGRAKSYKEATIGTPDAGAVSTSLFLQGLYEGYIKTEKIGTDNY